MRNPDIRGRKCMHVQTPCHDLRPSFHPIRTLLVLILAAGMLVSCAGRKMDQKRTWAPLGPEVSLYESPEIFVGSLAPGNQELTTWKSLAENVLNSASYVNRKPQSVVATSMDGRRITWAALAKTLQKFRDILPQLDANPRLLMENFEWVPIRGGIDYSGYYSPVVRASRTRKPGYEHPIYKTPPELRSLRAKAKKYHDRCTIECGQILAGRGLELAWAADPVDVFFLAIQGSGILQYDDGGRDFINYDEQNGHKYKSSGRIMREKGLLSRGDIFEQRQWLKEHPERVEEILHENPSFVFFKISKQGPTGAMGFEVQDWVSLATDRNVIPLGSIVAYGVNVPDESRVAQPLRAIGLAQDVGGAIKRNRIDIYCGTSSRSNYVASFLDAKGPAWILLAR